MILHELVQQSQTISDPLQDQLKVDTIFQPCFATNIPNSLQGRQLHSGDVNNCMSQPCTRFFYIVASSHTSINWD